MRRKRSRNGKEKEEKEDRINIERKEGRKEKITPEGGERSGDDNTEEKEEKNKKGGKEYR